ncbi:MAG: transporter [Bacteroidia bacterium]|nr:transporter [Bacteroidia bacterium]
MKIFWNLLLFWSTLFTSFACDVCGCFMGIIPFETFHQISLLHRYRVFNGYREHHRKFSFFPGGAYKIAHGGHNHGPDSMITYSSHDFESFKIFELRARVFALPRLEINGLLPFSQIKSKTDTVQTSHFGLSDPSVFFMYHIITPKPEKKFHFRWMAGMGIKIPSGNYYAKDNLGNRYPLLLQPGTGSVDVFFIQTFLTEYRNAGVQATVNYKINGKNYYNEKLGNSFTIHHSLFYKINYKAIKFMPSLAGYYEYTPGLYINGKHEKGTSMNEWMLGPGFDLFYRKFGFHFQFQKTLLQHHETGKLLSMGRFMAGISYSFK